MLSLRLTAITATRSVLPAIAVRAASQLARLDAKKMEVYPAYSNKPLPDMNKVVFGHEFTDHMMEIDWNSKTGWNRPVIKPFGDISMHPASLSLHYGIECFEGMKAYLDAQGTARLFRPMENIKRLNRSMHRLGLPELDQKEYLECIKQLVKYERRWIPNKRGFSLYIRPTVIGTQPTLGVHPSDMMKLYTILSPVGPYYKTGFAPVSLIAEDKYQRAWIGGTGDCKVGGNYALTILPQMEASAKGFNQILWLYGKEHYCTEVGTMNFLVYWKNKKGEKELITAPLDAGLILPGVTRDSVLDLCRGWGIKCTERMFSMDEVVEALHEKRVLEIFGSGTAAIVSPVKNITYQGVDYKIPIDPKINAGPLSMKLAETLLSIQYGELEHKDWSMKI